MHQLPLLLLLHRVVVAAAAAGGIFTAASAERLLQCLALACPLLEELHVLPEPTCGLGDDQVDHLLALTALKVREAATEPHRIVYMTGLGQESSNTGPQPAVLDNLQQGHGLLRLYTARGAGRRFSQRPAQCILAQECALCITALCHALL